jgi:glycosyltransferase involved in cell wall biosynthesis
VDGHCELVEDGRSGWLVPVENVPALAGAISSASRDLGEARRRGEEAKRRVQSNYSVQAMVDGWDAALQGLPFG